MTDALALMLPTPAEPPNGEYEVKDRSDEFMGKSVQLVATYPNGYGASVIQNRYSYGGDEGFFELAVKHGDELCYRTPITQDVIGWLTPEKVIEHLHEIARLPSDEGCAHSAKWTED